MLAAPQSACASAVHLLVGMYHTEHVRDSALLFRRICTVGRLGNPESDPVLEPEYHWPELKPHN
jgi:hypothetical protein